MPKLKVLIAGGGVGGLALAHGLIGRGVDVRVFERQPEGAAAGYRLHMNGDGGDALQALLPADLFELYLDTSRVDPKREQLVLVDAQVRVLGSRPHEGAHEVARRRDTAVNRRTLRSILMARLDQVIVPGEVVAYEETQDAVEVILSDGRRERGDLLIGFDGIHSRVRQQRLPQSRVMDTGLFGVYGRSPLTEQIRASLPDHLDDGFVAILGPRVMENGVLALGAYVPRVPVAEAASRRGLDVSLEAIEPYMMLGASIPDSIFETLGIVPNTATPAQLKLAMQELVRGWHESVVGLVDRAPADQLFATRVRYVDMPEDWAPSRVTLAGDAAHGMPPTLGIGANLALRDARELARVLTGIPANDPAAVVSAVAEYERVMREYAFPQLRRAITQEGSASGFTFTGLLRFIRMVGLTNLVRASRSRRDRIGTPMPTEEEGKP